MAEIESDQLQRAPLDETKVKNEDEEEEECILQFLDSLDAYLTLVDSLSSSLRQGWFDLASARQSMGHTRISSKLFDHKVHSASTTINIMELNADNPSDPKPQFSLSKWATTKENPSSEVPNNSNLRHRAPTGVLEDGEKSNGTQVSSVVSNDVSLQLDIQKERSKSLTIFGGLVSPKLRTAQVSFETALDKIVEIANARSSMLSSFSQLQLNKKSSS
ncbi:Coiled-coil domain-containing protein 115 [Rhynchospora pubera]|uniref:Vacuolar ATPase assembly protein VMA22 n=1 Tax=Rhynchospora pubera TaxID=906938 RepID=A0AAV8GP38_9POAL|nr:Coiled-coil domain-containing protein 115 [Rhynchospora pubera]